MKKIYIDAGTYNGGILQNFIEVYEMQKDAKNWSIFCFDPLTTYTERINGIIDSKFPKAEWWNGDENTQLNHFSLEPKALWTEDGDVTFYKYSANGSAPHDDGSGLMYWKAEVECKEWGGEIVDESKVPCISLSNFIKDNCSKEDFLVLKCNIEGAEYEIIKDLISTGAMDYVDEFFCDFHIYSKYVSKDLISKYAYSKDLFEMHDKNAKLLSEYIESRGDTFKINARGKWQAQNNIGLLGIQEVK